MKKQLVFMLIMMNCAGLFAQDSTLVIIKTGSRIKDVLTTDQIFVYPVFINAEVIFRNATKAKALMNYNSVTDQMLFIGPKSDTLALTDEKTIKFISLDKDTFYFEEGYVRLVTGNSIVKLAEKRVWEVADIRKMGSHNRPATNFAVASFSSLTDLFGRTYDLILNEDVVLRKKPKYYFGDMYNRFVPANKKNLMWLFPKEQNSLSNYLKVNKVNFNKKDDLEKITHFLAQNH